MISKPGYVLFTIVVSSFVFLPACKSKSKEDKFIVSGKLTNSQAKMIYLEEIPIANMQRVVLDSVEAGKDGKFELSTASKESSIYNIRLDQSSYPLASVINDAPEVTVNATFTKENPLHAETYEVKNSPASLDLKNFMVEFNGKMQAIYMNIRQGDSLRQLNAADSAVAVLDSNASREAQYARNLAMDYMNKSKNPALVMFILGYYQTTANNPSFRLPAMTLEEVSQVVDRVNAENPGHSGVTAIKGSLDSQLKLSKGLVGQIAPDFSMPDTEGNMVSLNSFRGKFVLVDFWASWCKPCRFENPNLVKAFNKYKDKNFTILGVALEQPGQKDKWLQAISEDQLTWTQISDHQFWGSPVVPLYGIQGIPFNVLLDPSGKVLAQSLRGEDLDLKLQEVLK